MKQNDYEQMSNFFKVLSNPIRLKILMHVASCNDTCHKHNISELSKDCDVDFSVVSRHLKALKDAGILSANKNKNDVIYQLNKKRTHKILSAFLKSFES